MMKCQAPFYGQFELWRIRRNTFGPQIGSRRLNVVTFVPFAKLLVKFGTAAQAAPVRFELNSGTNCQVVFVPVENTTTFVPT